MIVLGAWDGWGSSLVSGVAGGVVAMIVLLTTLRHERRVRLEQDRLTIARALIIEVNNLRDAALKSRAAPTGNYAMYGLRNQIALAAGAFGERDTLAEVLLFYEAIETLRSRVREHSAEWASTEPYRRALDERTRWLESGLHAAARGRPMDRRGYPLLPPLP